MREDRLPARVLGGFGAGFLWDRGERRGRGARSFSRRGVQVDVGAANHGVAQNGPDSRLGARDRPRSPSNRDGDYTFAWQGWTLRTPRDWGLTEERGDRRAGLFLLADEDRVRLELCWRPAQKGGRGGGRRLLPRPGGKVEVVEQPVSWLPRTERVREHRLLRTPQGREGIVEAAVSSLDFGRVALVRFFLDDMLPRASERAGVRRILGSIAGRGAEALWPVRLFDVSFAVPGAWPLRHRSLGVGVKQFVYECPVGSLHINALHLARRRPESAREWVAAFLRNAYPGIRVAVKPVETGVRIQGRTRPWVLRGRGLHAPITARQWTGRLVRRLAENTDYVVLFAHRSWVGQLPWDELTFGSGEAQEAK